MEFLGLVSGSEVRRLAIFNLFSSGKFKCGLVSSKLCIFENNMGSAALTKVQVLISWDNFVTIKQLKAEGDLIFSKLVVCAAPGYRPSH